MDLLGGKQRPIDHADRATDFRVRSIQSLEHLSFVVRYVDARNSARKNVATDFDRIERRKLLERKPRVSAIRWFFCVYRWR